MVQGGITASPLQVLCGHQDAVTCVTVVTELDMAVSGSKVTSRRFCTICDVETVSLSTESTRIYSRTSRKINDKILPQKLGATYHRVIK